MAETSSPVCIALRPHQFQLDESCGEMFGHLDNKAIRRGVFLSVADLQASIETFLKAWNKNPNLCVDRDRRIHSGKAHSLSPDFGADPARCTSSNQKTEAMTASYLADTTLAPSVTAQRHISGAFQRPLVSKMR